MHSFQTALMLALFSSASVACVAQAPANATPAQGAPPPQTAPSGLLQPSLKTVQQTVSSLKLEKWKKGSVRDEAGNNVNAIVQDLQTHLPPLLASVDATPGTMSKLLPVSRHIDALYDVLLRVTEAARVSAPGDQVDQLEQALVGLEKARTAFDGWLQDAAGAQEKQVIDLRTTLQTQQASLREAQSVPPPKPCPAPAPVKKPKKKRPPATPSTATPQTTPAPASGTTKPSN